MAELTAKQKAIIERQHAESVEANEILRRGTKNCETCGAGSSIFKEREQQMIDEMCTWFQQPGADKDYHVAVRYIAAVVEIRALQRALNYRERKGSEAAAALYGGE